MGGSDVALEVMDLISTGVVRPLIVEKTLEQVPECMQQISDCKTIGKMVVRMGSDCGETGR